MRNAVNSCRNRVWQLGLKDYKEKLFKQFLTSNLTTSNLCYGGLFLGSRQFLLQPQQLPQKRMLPSKVVKSGSKIIISFCQYKSMTHLAAFDSTALFQPFKDALIVFLLPQYPRASLCFCKVQCSLNFVFCLQISINIISLKLSSNMRHWANHLDTNTCGHCFEVPYVMFKGMVTPLTLQTAAVVIVRNWPLQN